MIDELSFGECKGMCCKGRKGLIVCCARMKATPVKEMNLILNPCSKETVLFLKLLGYLVLYSILLLLYVCLLRQRQPELLGTRL